MDAERERATPAQEMRNASVLTSNPCAFAPSVHIIYRFCFEKRLILSSSM